MTKLNPSKNAMNAAPPGEPRILPRIAPPPGTDCPSVIRCCEAWTRVYEETLAAGIAKHIAIVRGNQAYKNAMPTLINRDNIRNFIACVTYGLLIRAILDNVATKLLYAAQIASAACKYAPVANHSFEKTFPGSPAEKTAHPPTPPRSVTECLPAGN